MSRGLFSAIAITLLAALATLSGCSVNEATGRRQLSFFDRDWETSIGAQAAPGLITEFGGEVPDPALRQYVADIGNDLKNYTEGDNPSLPWTFTLLNSDVINAFALPGGKVFMSRGLAQRMTNEAQLAGVIGHEIGHVTARHTAERVSQTSLLQGAVQVAGVAVQATGDAALGSALPALQVGGQLVTLKFSRDQESESDSLGLRYMTKAGYNPIGMLQTMEILKAASGGSGQNEWTATHPLPETRIERIKSEIDAKYADTQNNAQYRTGEREFSEKFLRRLSMLPPATHGPRDDSAWIALGLPPPSAWCAHCAEQ